MTEDPTTLPAHDKEEEKEESGYRGSDDTDVSTSLETSTRRSIPGDFLDPDDVNLGTGQARSEERSLLYQRNHNTDVLLSLHETTRAIATLASRLPRQEHATERNVIRCIEELRGRAGWAFGTPLAEVELMLLTAMSDTMRIIVEGITPEMERTLRLGFVNGDDDDDDDDNNDHRTPVIASQNINETEAENEKDPSEDEASTEGGVRPATARE